MVEEDELGRIYLMPVRPYRRYTAEEIQQFIEDDQLTDNEWTKLEQAWGTKLRDDWPSFWTRPSSWPRRRAEPARARLCSGYSAPDD